MYWRFYGNKATLAQEESDLINDAMKFFKRLQMEISEIHIKFSYRFTSDWLITFTVRVHFPISLYWYRSAEPLIPPVLPDITRLRLNQAGKLAKSVYSSE